MFAAPYFDCYPNDHIVAITLITNDIECSFDEIIKLDQQTIDKHKKFAQQFNETKLSNPTIFALPHVY